MIPDPQEMSEEDWTELADFLETAISDSLDVDWQPSHAAALIVDRLREPDETVEVQQQVTVQ